MSSKSKKDPIIIMWTSTMYSFIGLWMPNHFVPLIETHSVSVLDIYDVDSFPPLNSTVANDSCNVCPTILCNPEVCDLHVVDECSPMSENAQPTENASESEKEIKCKTAHESESKTVPASVSEKF